MSLEHPENTMENINGIVTRRYHKMCLGHEIHMTRYVLFDMLVQNRVTTDDVIVTLKDRRFLYTQIFSNVIDTLTYDTMDTSGYTIINLSLITGSDITVDRDSIFRHYQHQVLDKFYSDHTKSLLDSIEYTEDIVDMEGPYIVIHYRYGSDSLFLKNMVDKIYETYGDGMNIVIFNNNISILKNNLEQYSRITFTEHLQTYASYLHHKNCVLFISEWSGGGQLAHYCYTGKILYYFMTYTDTHYVGHEAKYVANSMIADFKGPHWDFKHSTDIHVVMFPTISDLIHILPNHLPSTNIKPT